MKNLFINKSFTDFIIKLLNNPKIRIENYKIIYYPATSLKNSPNKIFLIISNKNISYSIKLGCYLLQKDNFAKLYNFLRLLEIFIK